jgi:methionine biosynthesis protein MetW
MEASEFYNTTYAKTQLDADGARRDRIRFLFPEIPEGLRILDVGCGPAADIDFLLHGSNEVHGIDIGDAALAVAEARGVVARRFDLMSNEPLPYATESFDMVIANDILEHVFDPASVLRECARVMRGTAVLIVSVPNHFYWKMRLRVLFGKDLILPCHPRATQWDYFHVRFFTTTGFKQLLHETGFSIIENHFDRFLTVPRGLPPCIDRRLARRFPDLFSLHFIVKAVKR